MYLIKAKTYELEYFVGDNIPYYAILSHVWADEEVLFQDLKQLKSAQKKKGFLKIRLTCHQALRDGLYYAWIDTCCINKESSAELSEAINSMFRWYSRAARCYAYLADLEVHKGEIGLRTRPPFANSVWFTRGWTLQELIAPPDVTFLDRDWVQIGTKTGDLLDEINQATGVDKQVLKDSSTMFRMTIAKRMSWAAKRKTTRKEDEAYCLLGLFGVNMPMLYGEDEGAFVRLQEELIRKTTDQSVFVHREGSTHLLARSPEGFGGCADVEPCLGAFTDEPFELTNAGLRITLPVLTSDDTTFGAVLNCHRNHRRLVLSLYPAEFGQGTTFFAGFGDRFEDISIVTPLTCPVKDIFIARRYESFYGHPSEVSSRYIGVYRLWVSTPDRNEGQDLGIAITALEPAELWNVAAPAHSSVISRLGDSVRRANFTLYDYFEQPPDEGNVLFELTRPAFEPMELRIRFKIQPKGGPGTLTFLCNLWLYEARPPHVDRCEPASHDVDSVIEQQLMSSPDSSLRVSMRIKQLKITAELEVTPDIYGGTGRVGAELILQLQVDKVDDTVLLDGESHEIAT